MTELLYSALTGDLLGAYYAVYNGTGRTYPEFIYENGMVKVIGQRKIGYRRQPEYQIVYRESIGALKFNHFVVEGAVMHFPVAIRDVTDLSVHNLKDWMRYRGIRLGVVTNFYDTAIRPIFLRL